MMHHAASSGTIVPAREISVQLCAAAVAAGKTVGDPPGQLASTSIEPSRVIYRAWRPARSIDYATMTPLPSTQRTYSG